jgi:choline dehydrogenase-like flavoprotein
MIRNRSNTVYHPVGTARMGSDDDAVCDSRLRVRGVAGLYIADASIMPRVVSGNTNAPSIMIGERCADFVKADLSSG